MDKKGLIGKKEIRSDILRLRDSLSQEDYVRRSAIIRRRFLGSPFYSNANTILFFVSYKSEVNTVDMIRESIKSKNVVVPICRFEERRLDLSELRDMDDLEENAYGIREPKNPIFVRPGDIGLAVVPGIVFDIKGNRVGSGMGFYDRLLPQISSIKIAVAFDFQVLDSVNTEQHDIPVDVIITDKRIINCRKNRGG